MHLRTITMISLILILIELSLPINKSVVCNIVFSQSNNS